MDNYFELEAKMGECNPFGLDVTELNYTDGQDLPIEAVRFLFAYQSHNVRAPPSRTLDQLCAAIVIANDHIRQQQTVIQEKDQIIKQQDAELEELRNLVNVANRDRIRIIQIQQQYIKMAKEINVIKSQSEQQIKSLQFLLTDPKFQFSNSAAEYYDFFKRGILDVTGIGM